MLIAGTIRAYRLADAQAERSSPEFVLIWGSIMEARRDGRAEEPSDSVKLHINARDDEDDIISRC